MSLVRHGVLQNTFDEARINEWRRSNLSVLPGDVFRVICESLDSGSTWREVVSLADDSRYALTALDVEQCARVIYCDINASPSKSLLHVWGLQRNMNGETLASFLHALRIERPLKYLKLPEDLVITVQPVSLLVAVEGRALELNCEATGFPYPVYEWFKEQTRITTAVSNTGRLRIDEVTAAVAGKYSCRIHHTNHVTLSVDVKFTSWCIVEFQPQQTTPVKKAGAAYGSVPVISQHPISQTLRQNDSLALSCHAQSSSGLGYHWVKDGRHIATGCQMQIPFVGATDAGEYYCIVMNEFGEDRSHSAMISVTTEPYIQAPPKPQLLREPADLSVGIGGDAIFVVEAEFGSDLSYQWLHNNESMRNATGPELRFPVEDSTCEGTYQCLVSSGVHRDQSVLSRPAKLSVTQGNVVYKAADKLALLIGVSAYKRHDVPLPGVKNDLHETVKVLEEMQFKVVSLLDLTLEEMHDAINMFCGLLSPDVYTIFYCAGHGFIANNGKHYLIPLDSPPDVSPSESMCIESVEQQMQLRKPKLLMLCLDICRRRMQSDWDVRPLWEVSTENSAPNRITLYAASEGQQAFEQSSKNSENRRGLFSQCLLDVIHKRVRVGDLYRALFDKFKALPYRTSPQYRDVFHQNPEMTTNCEDYDRSLHDPLDTKCYREMIDTQTLLWHRVHHLPSGFQIGLPLGSRAAGQISVSFGRVMSNAMEIRVAVCLPCGWDCSGVSVDNSNIPSALRPVESRFDKSSALTVFCVENLQRLREDLKIYLQFELISGGMLYRPTLPLTLGRPLIAFAYIDRTPTTILLSAAQITERKEAKEHTEDQSLSSDT